MSIHWALTVFLVIYEILKFYNETILKDLTLIKVYDN